MLPICRAYREHGHWLDALKSCHLLVSRRALAVCAGHEQVAVLFPSRYVLKMSVDTVDTELCERKHRGISLLYVCVHSLYPEGETTRRPAGICFPASMERSLPGYHRFPRLWRSKMLPELFLFSSKKKSKCQFIMTQIPLFIFSLREREAIKAILCPGGVMISNQQAAVVL